MRYEITVSAPRWQRIVSSPVSWSQENRTWPQQSQR